MANILVECPQCIASVRVGVLEPLQYLQKNQLCKVRYRDTKEMTREDIAWCDALVCVRGCEYPTLRVVEAAKRAGRFIAYFLDDDLLNIPTGNASTKYYSDHKIQQNLTKILSLSDVLWAVNPRIIEKYKQWCQRAVLAKVPARLIRKPPELAEVLKIVFAGSVDHSAMVQEKISPAVSRLLLDFPGKVEFSFIGADPKLPDRKSVTYYPYFDSYDHYQQVMESGNFALGLAPAYDTPFYSCKYYNKFVEYTSYGILGIYEEVAPYTDIVREGKNGYFCSGDAENWYRKIREIVENRNSIGQTAVCAQRELESDFSYAAVTSKIQIQIPELEKYQAPFVEAHDVQLPLMKWIFYQERVQLIFRMYGALACFVILAKVFWKLVKLIRRNWRSGT